MKTKIENTRLTPDQIKDYKRHSQRILGVESFTQFVRYAIAYFNEKERFLNAMKEPVKLSNEALDQITLSLLDKTVDK